MWNRKSLGSEDIRWEAPAGAGTDRVTALMPIVSSYDTGRAEICWMGSLFGVFWCICVVPGCQTAIIFRPGVTNFDDRPTLNASALYEVQKTTYLAAGT